MITEQQRLERRNHLGSSDVAALFGIDPYKTAFDVWLDKTGRADDFEGNENCDRGNDLEPVILNWAERELAAPLIRNVYCHDKAGTFLAANLDADCPQLDAIVEAKSSVNLDEWGEPYTDEIPERTIIQTHVGMFCAGRKMAYVPLLAPVFGRFDWRMYQVEFKPALSEAIEREAESFWKNHVMADTPPEGVIGSIEVLKRIRREPNKIADISGELVDRWIAAKAAAAQAKDDADAAQAEVLTAMMDAEGARTEDGRDMTYLETARKGYVVALCNYRTLRLLKNKK